MFIASLVYLLFLVFLVAMFGLKLYGIYLCFTKKWYIGLASLFVPFFAEIVGFCKLVLKKDVLKE